VGLEVVSEEFDVRLAFWIGHPLKMLKLKLKKERVNIDISKDNLLDKASNQSEKLLSS